jgi:hypothetical protein
MLLSFSGHKDVSLLCIHFPVHKHYGCPLTERSVCARGVVKGVTEFPEKHDSGQHLNGRYRQKVTHKAFPAAVQQLQT